MRILIWEQHFLGAGHFFRAGEIARALSANHEVCLLAGGRVPSVSDLPDRIKLIRLPIINVDIAKHIRRTYYEREDNLDNLIAADGGDPLALLQRRRDQILQLASDFVPDVLVTELFPLRRRLFAEELMPAMRLVRARGGHLVCSIREILQGGAGADLDALPSGAAKERQIQWHCETVDSLNRWFDLLMVHGDPTFIPLEDTLPVWFLDRIRVPIRYTGYVSRQLPASDTASEARRLAEQHGYVIVSVGSGGARGSGASRSYSHGSRAIWPSVEAWRGLCAAGLVGGRKMAIFVGTETPEDEYDAIATACNPDWFRVSRASSRFLDWLNHADLSISRAGYNTCADLLVTGTPAILLPSHSNLDQEPRARAFAEKGMAQVLLEDEATAGNLQEAILAGLGRYKTPTRPAIDGAATSAGLIEGLIRTGC